MTGLPEIADYPALHTAKRMERAAAAKQAHVWERAEHEWYVEPESATEALLSVERFVGDTLDPACGQGNIVKTMIGAGYRAYGTDIVRRTDDSWFIAEQDFLSGEAPPFTFENVVMNPPFYRGKGAEDFIRKALSLASGKVAAFVDIRFITGGKRANGLYAEHAPSRIWIVTPRVSCPPGEYLAAGNKAQGGQADWVWLVWDLTAPADGTAIGWLRRAP